MIGAAASFVPLVALAQPAPAQPAPEPAPPVQGYRLLGSWPHDPEAFTQGLFWLDGHLWESTGHVGRSTVRKVRLEDGAVLQSVSIPAGLFGEGIAPWGDEIVSLTWRDGAGFRWDRASLTLNSRFAYPGEGWGLTQNGRELIMSDGTSELRVLDPETFEERRRIRVTAAGRPVARLNELEWVRGEIFANVWLTGLIVRIDPETGKVTGIVDLRPLAAETTRGDPDHVLNGIAYDAAGDRLFVTGKNWPRLYRIELTPPAPAPRGG